MSTLQPKIAKVELKLNTFVLGQFVEISGIQTICRQPEVQSCQF